MLVEQLLLARSEESLTLNCYQAKSRETHVLNLIWHRDLLIKSFLKSSVKPSPAYEDCEAAVRILADQKIAVLHSST